MSWHGFEWTIKFTFYLVGFRLRPAHLVQYGCWCFPRGQLIMGYGQPVDDIDNTCRNHQVNNCQNYFSFFNIILSFVYIVLKWTRIMNAMATCNHIVFSARFIKTEEDYCAKIHPDPVHGLLANVMSTWVNISSWAY